MPELSRPDAEALARRLAARLWPQLNQKERDLIRRGLMPGEPVDLAEDHLRAAGVYRDRPYLMRMALLEEARKQDGSETR